VAVVGCGAVGVGRGGSDEIGVGPVACVGGEDGPGAVDDPDDAWWGCGRLLEDSWFWVLGVPGDNLRRAACAAASRGIDDAPGTCELGGSPSEDTRWGAGCSLSSEPAGAVVARAGLWGASCCS